MHIQFKEAAYAWVTAADVNHVHLGTYVICLAGPTECVIPDNAVWISVTVVLRNFDLAGTTAFSLVEGSGKGADLDLWECVSSSRTRCSCNHITVSVPGKTAKVYTPQSCRCDSAFAEQTWPSPVCSGNGYCVLGATDNVGNANALAERWDAYCDAAQLLFRGHTASDDVLLAVVLQRGAGHYEPEKVDDRGAAEITFCVNQDCDGQATSIALFANMLIANHCQLKVKHARLLTYLTDTFCEAAVVSGYAKAPRGGKGGKKFGHAWAALIRKDAPPGAQLTNCLLLEATAPICPLPGSHPGVLSNDDATAIERSARALAPSAKQIVVGVREFLDWYYGSLWTAYGANWATCYRGRTWAEACAGAAGKPAPSCNSACSLRRSLYPRITRGAEQTILPPDVAVRVTPPKMENWALASTCNVGVQNLQVHDLMSTHQYIYIGPKER